MSGSLQEKSGMYYIVQYIRDENGKSKQVWKSTGLKVEGNRETAEKLLAESIAKCDDITVNTANLLFSDYLFSWIKQVSFELQKSTIRGYKGCLNNHIIPYFKSQQIKLVDLKIRDLEAFYSHLRNKGLSPQTIRNHHAVIAKALNDAVRLELITRNPAPYAKKPKVTPYVGEYRNLMELSELTALFSDTPIYNAVKFAAIYGLRRSELLGLCWDAIDFPKNQFVIRRTLIQGEHENYLHNFTKNSSSYRALPLTEEAKSLLTKIKEEQKKNRCLLGEEYAENNFIFTWPDGKPISPNYITRKFHKVQLKNNLAPIRIHDLRHSAASNLIHQGFSINEVQNWLGHSQASTTLNIYCHVDASSKRNIQQFLDGEWNAEKSH